MLEFLQNIDNQVFYFINNRIANSFTDAFFAHITVEKHWFVFWAIMGLYLLIAGGKRGRIVLVLAIFTVIISDQFSNQILKELVGRIRPCHILQNVHLLVGCTSSYSFPSSHAVNNFAGAYLFSYFYPKMKWALYLGAFLMAVSRIFVGVHYPSDILGGALIGLFISWLIIILWKVFNRKVKLL